MCIIIRITWESLRAVMQQLSWHFAHYDPEYLLFLDNDMIVTRGLSRRSPGDAIESDEKHAQAQAKIRFHNEPQRINDAGGCRINFWLGRTNPVGFLSELDKGTVRPPGSLHRERRSYPFPRSGLSRVGRV
jgi:hypothetical protein